MDISSAFSLPHGRIAEIFYEMHCLCERELELNQQQKNLISLGYLLYSSADNMMLITSLRWANPELIIEVHQLMNMVCQRALLYISQHLEGISEATLSQYDLVARLILQKSREFKMLYS